VAGEQLGNLPACQNQTCPPSTPCICLVLSRMEEEEHAGWTDMQQEAEGAGMPVPASSAMPLAPATACCPSLL